MPAPHLLYKRQQPLMASALTWFPPSAGNVSSRLVFVHVSVGGCCCSDPCCQEHHCRERAVYSELAFGTERWTSVQVGALNNAGITRDSCASAKFGTLPIVRGFFMVYISHLLTRIKALDMSGVSSTTSPADDFATNTNSSS